MASTSTESDVAPASAPSTYATSEPMASGSASASRNDNDRATDAPSSSTSSKARLEELLGEGPAAGDSTAAPSETATPDSSSAQSAGDNDGTGSDSTYECTICLETAKDAVVSMCGHLFCWPCLHQWLETRPHRQMCPVCKAAISKEKVIPLYGRDNKNKQDPRWVLAYIYVMLPFSSTYINVVSFVVAANRTKAPPRPTAQRTEPESSTFHGFGFPEGGGFHMSFGIGAFPFGFFTSTFNFGNEARVARKYLVCTHNFPLP